MKWEWIVSSNHIALRCGDRSINPSAGDIYNALSDDSYFEKSGIDAIPLTEAFPEIFFSGIDSAVKCIITDDGSGEIQFRLCCFRKGIEICVDYADGKIIDQCLTPSGEWFYVSGDTEELEEIFHDNGIMSEGRITVAQYIGLIRGAGSLSGNTIDNRVETSTLDKPVDTSGQLPDGLNGNLYEYQKTGYFWMRYMLSENGGCILGDEMGLGKTVQVITLILEYIHSGKSPVLVIAPVSLLENWKSECEKFAPGINVLIHHGARRTGFYTDLTQYDLIITSYGTAVSDLSMLNMIMWPVVVLDEAQNIKNPASIRAKHIKQIKKQTGIAVTGTPFENHVTDIWSIVDFVFPNLFGTLSEYTSLIPDDIYGAEKVEPMLSPLMIRRNVSDVAKDLPDRVIIPLPVTMSEPEAEAYENIRIASGRSAKSKDFGLDILQSLRIYCTHPCVYDKDTTGDPAEKSMKYQCLCGILENIFATGEKAILFTSYLIMFDILESDIPRRFNVPVYKINGSTPVGERQKIIDEFGNIRGGAMLVLNPHAAGTGLNITAANHVIHYNLEWNPAVEDQASARSYRRGQEKTVFVYRLFYVNTVEQVINERIERKRDIADKAVIGIDGSVQDRKDIIEALNASPIGG